MDVERTVDGLQLKVSTGGGDLGKVKNLVFSWEQLRSRLAAPVVDSVHSLDEYVNLSIGEQGRLKNVGFFVGGHCKDGARNANAIEERSVVCFDVDEPTPEQISDLKMGMTPLDKYEWFAHTTRKHRPEKPRWRVVLPLTEPITADHYQILSRIMAASFATTVDASMDAVDPVSFRVAQVMYWPSHCHDAEFDTIWNRGETADPQSILESWGNWRDWSTIPQSAKRPSGRQTEHGKKAEIPTEKRGIVGAFCRAYDVPTAIDKFLPDIYVLGDDKHSKKPRYTYLNGSAANGAIIEDGGLFLYSHHGTDPCGERLVNAFDMVRLHLFGGEDNGKPDPAKPTEATSYKAMGEFLTTDEAVIRELQKDHYDVDAMFADLDDDDEVETVAPRPAAFDDDIEDLLGGAPPSDKGFSDALAAAKDDKGWLSELDLTEKGTIKATLTNLAMILQHDPRLRGVIQLNEFIREVVTRKPMRTKMKLLTSIPIRDKTNGDIWSDRHNHNLRALLEAPSGKNRPGYGLKVTDRDLDGAVALAGAKCSYHPVREYLTGLTWDGVERLDSLFVRYLGAPDDSYTRSISRLTLLGAVTRVMEPGHKFDFVLILEGLQGKRKSTFISILARDWFSELEGSLEDRKKLVEQMQGSWIMEIPELSGFNRVEAQELKAFVSAREDKVRMSYGRRADVYPRQCIFIGSTNDSAYLRDNTGGRRFWPVLCEVDEIDTKGFSAEVDQVWAEAVAAYRQMREEQPGGTLPLFIRDADAQETAAHMQEGRRVETPADALAGVIAEWLDKPILGEDGFEDDVLGAANYHSAVCGPQIWVECLGGDLKQFNQANAMAVGQALKKLPGWVTSERERLPKYGRQRVYQRIGSTFVVGKGKLVRHKI